MINPSILLNELQVDIIKNVLYSIYQRFSPLRYIIIKKIKYHIKKFVDDTSLINRQNYSNAISIYLKTFTTIYSRLELPANNKNKCLNEFLINTIILLLQINKIKFVDELKSFIVVCCEKIYYYLRQFG